MATHTPAVCWLGFGTWLRLLLAVALVVLLWSENFEVGKVVVVFAAVDVVDIDPCTSTGLRAPSSHRLRHVERSERSNMGGVLQIFWHIRLASTTLIFKF